MFKLFIAFGVRCLKKEATQNSLCIYMIFLFFGLYPNTLSGNDTDFAGQEKKLLSVLKDNLEKRRADSILKDGFYAEFQATSSDSLVKLLEYAKTLDFASGKYLDDTERGKILRSIGTVFYRKNKIEYAMKFFEKSKNSFMASGNQHEIARTNSNLAVLQEITGNYKKALEYYFEALVVFGKNEDIRGQSYVTNNIAVTYEEMKNPQKALFYYHKAHQLKKQLGDSTGIASTLNNIGVLYEEELLNNDSAFFYYSKALSIYDKINDQENYALVMNNIAMTYILNGQYDIAERYTQKAIAVFTDYANVRGLYRCYKSMVIICIKRGKLEQAELFLEKCIREGNVLNDLSNRLDVLQLKQEILTRKGRTDEALENFSEYTQLKDSIVNLELQQTVAHAETRYNLFEKEQEINKLSVDNKLKNQKIRFGAALILILILVLLFGIYFFVTRRKQAVLKQSELNQKLLRSQMNPHFIFNALGSIQHFMYNNDNKKAAMFLGNFASLSRSILKYSAEESISLEEETEMLRNYISLEKMRLKDAFEYEIESDAASEPEFIFIPPMMVQPFVENAIKHGLSAITSGGFLRLAFNVLDDCVRILIEDNGKGINQSVREKSNAPANHQSFAIDIFNQRLQLLQSKKQIKPGIKIKDLSQENITGTRVEIVLPMLTEKKASKI